MSVRTTNFRETIRGSFISISEFLPEFFKSKPAEKNFSYFILLEIDVYIGIILNNKLNWNIKTLSWTTKKVNAL